MCRSTELPLCSYFVLEPRCTALESLGLFIWTGEGNIRSAQEPKIILCLCLTLSSARYSLGQCRLLYLKQSLWPLLTVHHLTWKTMSHLAGACVHTVTGRAEQSSDCSDYTWHRDSNASKKINMICLTGLTRYYKHPCLCQGCRRPSASTRLQPVKADDPPINLVTQGFLYLWKCTFFLAALTKCSGVKVGLKFTACTWATWKLPEALHIVSWNKNNHKYIKMHSALVSMVCCEVKYSICYMFYNFLNQ